MTSIARATHRVDDEITMPQRNGANYLTNKSKEIERIARLNKLGKIFTDNSLSLGRCTW
jgi:hypothetical protein